MSLAMGIRLGAFEILARIGAGGMGEVYRARDSKLGRRPFRIRPDVGIGAYARENADARRIARHVCGAPGQPHES